MAPAPVVQTCRHYRPAEPAQPSRGFAEAMEEVVAEAELQQQADTRPRHLQPQATADQELQAELKQLLGDVYELQAESQSQRMCLQHLLKRHAEKILADVCQLENEGHEHAERWQALEARLRAVPWLAATWPSPPLQPRGTADEQLQPQLQQLLRDVRELQAESRVHKGHFEHYKDHAQELLQGVCELEDEGHVPREQWQALEAWWQALEPSLPALAAMAALAQQPPPRAFVGGRLQPASPPPHLAG